MPAVSASGEIFSLSADGRYEGIIRAGGGFRTGLGVDLEAGFCHGISLEASAAAMAELDAAIGVFLRAHGSAFATASAGVRARAQVAPNIFERLGLFADVAAYAEAAAGGRLAIGLDFGTLEALGRSHLSGLEWELFSAFLRETICEAGAWGRVSAAAAAAAYVQVGGSLGDADDAGFDIAVGAAAGLGAGGGSDVYLRVGLTDPRRLVGSLSSILTREIVTQAREAVPAELAPSVELLDLLLPVALQTIYDVGKMSSLGTLAPPEQMVAPFTDSFLESLQRWTLDKVIEAAGEDLGQAIEGIFWTLAPDPGLEGDALLSLEAEAEAARAEIAAFANAELTLDDVATIGARIVSIAEAAAPELVEPLRRPIAAAWCALACAQALAGVAETTWSARASAIGAGAAGDRGTLTPPALATAPSLVAETVNETLGRPSAELGLSDAIDYLIEAGLAGLLTERVPAASVVVVPLADALDLSIGELVESALRLGLGEDAATLPLYRSLREYANDALDGVISGELLPAMRSSLGAEGRAYVDEVAAPCLQGLSSFILERLDAVVGGVGSADVNPFLESLSAGASTLLYRLCMRHVLFVDHVVFSHVQDSMADALAELASDVRGQPGHVLVETMRDLLPVQMPGVPVLDPADLQPLQNLIAELALAGRDASGGLVWTAGRRERLRELKESLLIGFEGTPDFEDSSGLDDLFRDLILCDHIPREDALEELAKLLAEVVTAFFGLVVPRATQAVITFTLEVTRGVVELIDETARAAIDAAVAAAEAALAMLEYWGGLLRAAEEAVEAAARATAAALQAVEDALRAGGLRQQVKDSLYADGAAAATASGIPGALEAFDVAFWLAEPLVDAGIDVVAEIAGDAGDFIEGAADAEDALESLTDQLIEDARDAVSGAASDLGITLPSELSGADVAAAIADALPTGWLLDLLDAAIEMSRLEQAAIDDRSAKAAERDRAQAEYDRSLAAQAEASPAGETTVEIVSPIPMPSDPSDAWAYGPQIPVRARVGGATAAYFRGPNSRVRVALNAAEIHVDATEWREREDGRFEWAGSLTLGTHPLLAGLNVFEVAVADGEGRPVRAVVAFLHDPNAPPLPALLEVVPELSRLDAPGNDHERAAEEWVTLRWSGRDPLPIGGWRIQDEGGKHVLFFEDVEIRGNDTLRVVTGGNPSANSANVINWSRRAAVWNNTGDTVRLIDNLGIVRADYFYEG